jgi:hypothetical protein
MAIIGDQAAQGAQAPPQEAPVEQSPQQEQGAPAQEGGAMTADTPTGDEQEQFTRYELAIKTAIQSEAFKNIAKTLADNADNPVEILAEVSLNIFSGVDESATEEGIPEELFMRLGEATLDQVVKVAEDTGAFQVDEAMAEAALKQMIVKMGKLYGFNTEEMEKGNVEGQTRISKEGGQGGQQPPPEEAPVEQPAQQPPVAPQQVPPTGGM